MEEKNIDLQLARKHDEKIYCDGIAIFSEGDLRELINTMYSEYQYTGIQADKLNGLISYLTSENNRYLIPELAKLSEVLSDYLNTLRDFLEKNFYRARETGEGDMLYFFKMEKTSAENEGFLMELQMLAMDVEGAYRKYIVAANSRLQL
jgi:hypothetical protein